MKPLTVIRTLLEAGTEEQEWWGVDFDGTLSYYDEWRGPGHVGKPVEKTVNTVRKMLDKGIKVKIFTARVATPEHEEEAREAIQKFCKKNLGVILPITNEKDPHMVGLIDDKVEMIKVEPNTGRVIEESHWGPTKKRGETIEEFAKRLIREFTSHTSHYWNNARQGSTHEQYSSSYSPGNAFPYPKTAWDINCGHCENFAEELQSQFPGGRIEWLEDLSGDESFAHCVYFYNGKYYDSQSPEGVTHWKELLTYRGIPRDEYLKQSRRSDAYAKEGIPTSGR